MRRNDGRAAQRQEREEGGRRRLNSRDRGRHACEARGREALGRARERNPGVKKMATGRGARSARKRRTRGAQAHTGPARERRPRAPGTRRRRHTNACARPGPGPAGRASRAEKANQKNAGRAQRATRSSPGTGAQSATKVHRARDQEHRARRRAGAHRGTRSGPARGNGEGVKGPYSR